MEPVRLRYTDSRLASPGSAVHVVGFPVAGVLSFSADLLIQPQQLECICKERLIRGYGKGGGGRVIAARPC